MGRRRERDEPQVRRPNCRDYRHPSSQREVSMSRVCPCLLWSFLVLLFGLFSRPLSAFAQDIAMADQQEVIEVPDVVVSATKTPQAPKQVTSAVEVITGEEMQQRKI